MAVVTPEWVKDAVFYQIFPDRFARSDAVRKPSNLEPWDSEPTPYGFKGGDLMGVVERLDYLSDLGINAIYFTPIFQSASNHRYHTHDYLRVDPILGGDEALKVLLGEAHRRGIRVVLDGVFNHASRGFFQFNHLLECGEKSPYVDWFTVNGFPVNAYGSEPPNFNCWWNLPALPKFNTTTPAVRDFIWDVAEHWVKFGIDGWRLDVPHEIDDDSFWQEFRRRVKGANPEAYIVGEIWTPAQRWLQGDQFDAVMNYLFARAAIAFFGGKTLTGIKHGPYVLEAHDAADFAGAIASTFALYDWQIVQVQMNLLGSHDTARFLSIVGDDVTALKLSTLFQMTMPGAPCIYYGDELGLSGGPEPASRGTIPWDRLEELKGDLWNYTREAVALRNQHPVLRRGLFETVYAKGDVMAFTRTLDSTKALVVFNAGADTESVSLPITGLTQVVLGQPEKFTATESGIGLVMPGRTGIVIM